MIGLRVVYSSDRKIYYITESQFIDGEEWVHTWNGVCGHSLKMTKLSDFYKKYDDDSCLFNN